MKKKKITALLCLILAMLMVLGACGSNEVPKEDVQKSPAAEAPAEKPEEAQYCDTLRVAISSDVSQWDIVVFPSGDGRFVWNQIYDTLVRLDKDLNMIPGLALSWESKDDGLSWIFHLREGVKFHDGSDFNADAVLYSYSERSNVIQAGTLPLESLEKIDDYTVKFVCKKPVPLPTYLTHIAWPVVSPSSLDENGEFKAPIGSGPFKFVSQTKGQEIVVERNEDYWGGAPETEKVVFKVIPDAASRVLALRSGDVDMCLKIAESDVVSLEQDPDIVINRTLSTFTDFIQFNTARAPFDDQKVRQAVAWAVDTEAIVDNILDGIGIAARGRAYSPCMMYCAPDEELTLYSQDIEKAKACLEESGWTDEDGNGIREKDGKELSINIMVGQSWSPREIKIAQVCQSQLEQVDFKVQIDQLEGAAFSERNKAGDFDCMLRTGFFVWGPYPHHVKMHFSKNYASHFSDPEYDELIKISEGVPDDEKPQVYRDIMQMILQKLPAYYIVHEEKIVACRSNVKGYEISAEDPWLELRGVKVEK